MNCSADSYRNICSSCRQTTPYQYVDVYWDEDDRLPFLIEAEAQIVGFCLVRVRGRDWTIAEFAVIPEQRRNGVGRAAVEAVVVRADGVGANYVEATVQVGKGWVVG